MTAVVMGLDLSLLSPAYVVLLPEWHPGEPLTHCASSALPSDALAMTNKRLRSDPEWTIRRIAAVADWVMTAARHYHVTNVFVEDYAYSASATAGRTLAELGGAVKIRLYDAELLVMQAVPASAERKALLGHVPSKKKTGMDVKAYVRAYASEMGVTFKTDDEVDAFVIANYGRCLIGRTHLGVVDGWAGPVLSPPKKKQVMAHG